jgi:hypothetical protein
MRIVRAWMDSHNNIRTATKIHQLHTPTRAMYRRLNFAAIVCMLHCMVLALTMQPTTTTVHAWSILPIIRRPTTVKSNYAYTNEINCETNDDYSANMHSCMDVETQRRHFFDLMIKSALTNGAVCVLFGTTSKVANAIVGKKLPGQFIVDDCLKTGTVMNPVGVSGQAGTFRSFLLPRFLCRPRPVVPFLLLYSHRVVFLCHSYCINPER